MSGARDDAAPAVTAAGGSDGERGAGHGPHGHGHDHLHPSGETIEVPAGTSLLDAAILCELDVAAPCAGQGRCGRCRVRVTAGEVERRSNAGLETAEILDGWAVACQTYVSGAVEVEVPERRRGERCGRTATPSPSRESLPFTCDWRQNPAVRTFELDIEPPSLADNTSDFDRLRRALPSSTASRRSAPSCPCCAASARTCACPTGR